MNLKSVFVFLVILIVLSACSGGGEERKISLENVIQSMETQGLKVFPIHLKGGKSHFGELNHVTAVTYAIDTYSMDKLPQTSPDSSLHTDAVNVYIFIFDSEQAQNVGRKNLDEKLASANFVTIPSVYEKKNVLVVHFKLPDEKVEYDDMIKKAVKNL
ncbi:hypothetical protein [Paenibacillus wynnii]|uniref:Lipoprotein n=1 Tax=Paenibacillus wynnii TaxID=268407 RepID=A0A098M5H6_9BACL|nr:hypothetical protein [Paenibacillus wynnii]KGE17298.1 hypothetical protein PWYN_22015 [Paenibacillus wynnii]